MDAKLADVPTKAACPDPAGLADAPVAVKDEPAELSACQDSDATGLAGSLQDSASKVADDSPRHQDLDEPAGSADCRDWAVQAEDDFPRHPDSDAQAVSADFQDSAAKAVAGCRFLHPEHRADSRHQVQDASVESAASAELPHSRRKTNIGQTRGTDLYVVASTLPRTGNTLTRHTIFVNANPLLEVGQFE
jgi:hypothetical protein